MPPQLFRSKQLPIDLTLVAAERRLVGFQVNRAVLRVDFVKAVTSGGEEIGTTPLDSMVISLDELPQEVQDVISALGDTINDLRDQAEKQEADDEAIKADKVSPSASFQGSAEPVESAKPSEPAVEAQPKAPSDVQDVPAPEPLPVATTEADPPPVTPP